MIMANRAVSVPQTVLVLDGDWPNTAFVVAALGRIPGLRVHVVAKHPDAPVARSHVCHRLHVVPHGLAGADLVQWLAREATDCSAGVVLPTSQWAVRFVAEHHEQFTAMLPTTCALAATATPGVLDSVDDKGAFSRLLSAHDLPAPDTMDGADLVANLPPDRLADGVRLRYPVIVKPKVSFAGCGIFIAQNRDHLVSRTNGADFDWSSHILQSYVPGFDIDCSVLCDRGRILAYTIQRTRLARYGFGPPAVIEFVHHCQVLEATSRLMKALNWSGVAHVDLRYDDRERRVKILEVNARFWASLSGSVAAGVNFPHLACLAAAGHDFKPPTYRRGWYVCSAEHSDDVQTPLPTEPAVMRRFLWQVAIDDGGRYLWPLAHERVMRLKAGLRQLVHR